MNWLSYLSHSELKALDHSLSSMGWKAFVEKAVPEEIERLHRILEVENDDMARGEVVKAKGIMTLQSDVKKLLTSPREEV
jgi:hypothetical protein